MMEVLRIVAGSQALATVIIVVVVALLVFITVNRMISGNQRREDRRLNIDAEADRLKRIGDRTGHYNE